MKVYTDSRKSDEIFWFVGNILGLRPNFFLPAQILGRQKLRPKFGSNPAQKKNTDRILTYLLEFACMFSIIVCSLDK